MCVYYRTRAYQDGNVRSGRIFSNREYGKKPLIGADVYPIQSAARANNLYGLVVERNIRESEILGRNEIGIKSLRTEEQLGFASTSRVVMITEINKNKTCKPDELVPLGRLFFQ